ncbi:M23 family metallopeptidase [Nocardioides sp. zg-DK7169]|nr:M23 family metallopeptidase [Nocardioides sp. zg-DK7169]
MKQPSPRRRRLLPSVPAAVGAAALAASIGGAVVTSTDDSEPSPEAKRAIVAASALSGASSTGSVRPRGNVVSRDGSRDALDDATDSKLVKAAEAKNAQRNTALQKLSAQAEAQAEKIKRNQWVLPVSGYRLTARYGQSSGLWASVHTGLDFAAPAGTPLLAVANATVTSTGYEGAYGNKTVLTLEDGTEIWYCHQTSIEVSVGDKVHAGQRIGTLGSTGNSTGPHLHLEVRPGGGDPVDPESQLHHHGLHP